MLLAEGHAATRTTPAGDAARRLLRHGRVLRLPRRRRRRAEHARVRDVGARGHGRLAPGRPGRARAGSIARLDERDVVAVRLGEVHVAPLARADVDALRRAVHRDAPSPAAARRQRRCCRPGSRSPSARDAPTSPRQSWPGGSSTTGSIAAPCAGIGIVMCWAGRSSGSYHGASYHGAIGSKNSTDSNSSSREPEPLVERASARHVGDAERDVVDALRAGRARQRAPEARPLDHLELRPPGIGDVGDVEGDAGRAARRRSSAPSATRSRQRRARRGPPARRGRAGRSRTRRPRPTPALRAPAAGRRRRAPGRA